MKRIKMHLYRDTQKRRQQVFTFVSSDRMKISEWMRREFADTVEKKKEKKI